MVLHTDARRVAGPAYLATLDPTGWRDADDDPALLAEAAAWPGGRLLIQPA